jgi:hypothetical protein
LVSLYAAGGRDRSPVLHRPAAVLPSTKGMGGLPSAAGTYHPHYFYLLTQLPSLRLLKLTEVSDSWVNHALKFNSNENIIYFIAAKVKRRCHLDKNEVELTAAAVNMNRRDEIYELEDDDFAVTILLSIPQ